MPEVVQNPYVSFVGGLVTEYGELNFPEGSSVDELNCTLFKDGSRRRRLGIEYETGSVLTHRKVGDADVVSTGVWKNVGEQSGLEYVVVQVRSYLRFYRVTGGSALSADVVSDSVATYEVDLSDFENLNSLGAGSYPVQLASIKGALVVASPGIDTFYITYDVTSNTYTETAIVFSVRDFEYLGDTENYFTSLSVYDSLRLYDTLNSGWVKTEGSTNPLTVYQSDSGNELPQLTHPWYSSKGASGNFSFDDWADIYAGTSLIANGHYVLDLYNMNRFAASGVIGVPITVEKARFSCVASYSGRMFYAGMSNSTADNGTKIYFSRLLERGYSNLGKCYSVNDPTAETISDLLDTDGGYVSIEGAVQIKKLHVFGAALYVFADNGVWKISGVDDVFRATEYSVSKVSEDGLVSVNSFCSAQGRPYWWSNSGIFTFVRNELGDINPQNMSVTTIQSYWEESTTGVRDSVQTIYDEANRRVIWGYPSSTTEANKLNKFLVFDEVLQAFYPWEINNSTDGTCIVGMVFDSGVVSNIVELNVVDKDGNFVLNSGGDQVVVSRSNRDIAASRIKFVTRDGTTNRVTFSELTSTSFLDWGDTDYTSFAEAAYNFIGDLEQRKTTTYITAYTRVTEEGFKVNGDATGYDTVRPGSLLISSFWDFKKTPSTTAQQAYRLKYTPVVNVGDLNSFDYPESVLATRIKLRGRGRVVKFRFASETGKDFNILGYNVISTKTGRY